MSTPARARADRESRENRGDRRDRAPVDFFDDELEARRQAINAARFEREAQLVVEIFVRDLRRSLDFYQALGFGLERRTGTFAALSWGNAYLFLDQRADLIPAPVTRASVRVMVEDVDAFRELAATLGARVVDEIGDRDYGLRDFTLVDPDGFGVRFAQPLT
jgi:catechol 2,3-dioxygenase-like lactoylglutathione lyase family enzyme